MAGSENYVIKYYCYSVKNKNDVICNFNNFNMSVKEFIAFLSNGIKFDIFFGNFSVLKTDL